MSGQSAVKSKNRGRRKVVVTGAALGLVALPLSFTVARAAATSAAALEEIVVTARKRDESLLDVPVSVAAFSGAKLEKYGIGDVTDIIGRTPGLYFSSSVISPAKDLKLANGRISFDASVYRIDLRDQQLQTVVEVGEANVPVSAIDNAGEGHTQGFEISASFLLTPALRLDTNLGYVSAEYDEYLNEEGLNRGGDPFPYVPEKSAQIGAEYRLPLGEGGRELILYGNYQYVGGYETGTGTAVDPIFGIDAYDRLDIRLSLESERWNFTVFADNLLDSYDVTHVWNAFFFADNALNYNQVLPPRRVGARLTYSF